MNRPVFKTLQGKIVDPIKHSINYIQNNPDTKIYIGTDSVNIGSFTKYATVIAYRVGNRGVHIIVHKRKVNKITDIKMRLRNEAEISMDVVCWIQDNSSIKIEAVELDYNSDESYISNQVMGPVKGWVKGMGLKVIVKPELQIAVKAADRLCQ